MAHGYGMEGYLAGDFQASFGTAKVTSLEPFPILSENLSLDDQQRPEGGMYGRLAESPYHQGTRVIRGAVNFEAHPIGVGIPLKSVLGAPTTTSDTNDQTHVFKPLTADWGDRAAVNPITLDVYRGVDSSFQYHDMCGDAVELNFANGEFVGGSWELMGGGFTRKVAATPTFLDGSPYQWHQSSWQIDGAADFEVRRLTLRFTNQLEGQYTLVNTRAPYRFVRTGPQMVSLSGRLVFAAQSHHLLYESGSAFAFVGYLAGAESPNSLLIEVPKMRFLSYSPRMEGPGIVHVDFTAQGEYHPGSATALSVTLVNTREYY